MASITCVVVTPESTAFEQQADFVVVPLYDGELGVAHLHSPMIGRLGYGELRLRTGTTTERYYVDGGFVQVLDDVVTVLTNRAVAADQLDVEASQKQLAQAKSLPIMTPEQQQIRNRLVAQAQGQIRVARHVSQ